MKDFYKRNIIILSSVDWDSHRQLHHELVEHLVQKKNKILFIENTGSRNIRFTDFPRIKKRILNFMKSAKGFKKLNEKITLFSPLFFPYFFSLIFNSINSLIILKLIHRWMKKNNFSDPIIINFIPNPITFSIINTIKSNLVIYYMADNMTQNNKKFREIEKKIISKSQLVFYSSINLQNKISNKKKGKYLPNGVNYKIFNKNITRKKCNTNTPFEIVYLGAVRDIINHNIILKISINFPNDKIYIIGPILTKFEKLYKQKNIIFIGQIKHSLVPRYLKKSHIGILPYKINTFTKSINPLKIYEYISSGLPVVSTNLPNVTNLIKNYPKIKIFKAKSDDAFIKHISEIKKKYKQNTRNEIDKFLKENAWEKRFKFLEKWILIKEYENKYIYKKNSKINKLFIFNSLFNFLFLLVLMGAINIFFKII